MEKSKEFMAIEICQTNWELRKYDTRAEGSILIDLLQKRTTLN